MSTSSHVPLDREHLIYDLDPDLPGLLVEPGAEVTLETEDAMSGQVRRPGERRDKSLEPRFNPVNGPVRVRGARVGQTLVVEVLEVEPLIGQCATYVGAHPHIVDRLGPPPDDLATRVCSIDAAGVHWAPGMTLPYRPMIGVFAVSPGRGAPHTGHAGDYGGNLDLPEIAPGATVRLPIMVPEACLYVGDCHAGQGQGEVGGTALEMPAHVRLRVDVEDRAVPGPRIETAEELAAVATGGTVDEAAATAAARLALWLEEDGCADRWAAYSLLTQVGSLTVGYLQTHVVAMKIERRYLDIAV